MRVMRLTDFLHEVGRPLSYYPSLKKVTGSTIATIFLTQFIYWTGKQNDPDGWIYKTQAEIEEETGLSRSEQETARRQLKFKGLIEEEYRGLPRKIYYRVNIAEINNLWSIISAKTLGNHNNAGIQHYCMRESSKQECDNPAGKHAGIQHAITEITTEITTKETTTTEAPVVVSFGEKEKDPSLATSVYIDREVPVVTYREEKTPNTVSLHGNAVKEIIAVTIGTPLDGMIPESVIPTLIADYNPQSHQQHQPEIPLDGIKRLIQWTATQVSNPKATPIPNLVGFLRERAKKGMDKPAAVMRDEQEAKTKKREDKQRQRKRQETEKLRDEREIPTEVRRDINRLLGRSNI